MAPQQSSHLLTAVHEAEEQFNNLDLNHNIAEPNHKPATVELDSATQQQRLRIQKATDMNERTRSVIRNCLSHLNTNLNVLVVGGSGAGKSSLINSMKMALDQKFKECAKLAPGRNHIIDECVMFNNRGTGGKVIFCDTRGFEGIHEDEHAVLILRYVLEGRIPPKCIPVVLLMPKETIKKRYHRVSNPHRRIDMVLYVSDVCKKPEVRLMGLLAQALNSSKIVCISNVPIISVVTKSDAICENELISKKKESFDEYNLESLCFKLELQSHPKRKQKLLDRSNKDDWQICKPKLVNNYRCELEPWNDELLDQAQ